MITVEVMRKDIPETEVRNLPGSFFAGPSPLLRPFLPKLEGLLPPERQGRGMSYVFSALREGVDYVQATQEVIWVQSRGMKVEITRADLDKMMGDKYPASDHQRLNLPGLLYLQSGPALQKASLKKLRQQGISIPDGRRTQRYIFHLTVTSLEADLDKVRIDLDLERLPRPKAPV